MKCGLCDFKTSDLEEMNNHIGKDGHFAVGKQAICPHCPYIAAHPQELLNHGKSHFAGFVLIYYLCTFCNFRSLTLDGIEKHQENHKTAALKANNTVTV